MTGQVAIYLCEEKKQKSVDIFFMGKSCNQQFIKMAKKLLPHLYGWPYFFFKSADFLNQRIPGGNKHRIFSELTYGDRDVEGVLDKIPTQFKFSEEEERLGRQELGKLGIPEKSSFVCLVVRDEGYFSFFKPGYDDSGNSCRNSDIDNFILACEYLISKGYYVVRMGAKVLKPLKMTHPQIIDYAYNGQRTDFMDIYLSSKCAFCVSTGTGFELVPVHVFRKPAVFVNWAHPGKIHTYSDRYLILIKNFFSQQENRILTLKEIFKDDFGLYLQDTSELLEKNIELLENSPEEIRDIVSEMVQRLENTWVSEPQDEILQKRFWELFPTKGISKDYGVPFHGKIRARYSAHYLRAHSDWLM